METYCNVLDAKGNLVAGLESHSPRRQCAWDALARNAKVRYREIRRLLAAGDEEALDRYIFTTGELDAYKEGPVAFFVWEVQYRFTIRNTEPKRHATVMIDFDGYEPICPMPHTKKALVKWHEDQVKLNAELDAAETQKQVEAWIKREKASRDRLVLAYWKDTKDVNSLETLMQSMCPYAIIEMVKKLDPMDTHYRYCVDGHEYDNIESNLTGDGEYAPFFVFDIEDQNWLPTPYPTREDAEKEAERLNLGVKKLDS